MAVLFNSESVFMICICICFQANECGKQFLWKTVDVFAEDLIACIDAQEPVFGGDLLSILTAMQKVINEIENHVNKSGDLGNYIDLVFKVNQVK